MRGKKDADWPQLVESWKAAQAATRAKIKMTPLETLPRFVAGADAAFSNDKSTVFAAAVVYDREAQRIIEVAHATRAAEVPYIPGFLSFREGDTILAAIRSLKHEFGAVLFDGQGYAHPRRAGVASHLAVTLDIVGVGVGKSRLLGTFDDPDDPAGSSSPLMDKDEQIGLVLRTRDSVNPLFVSIGHRVDLESAKRLVLACTTKYRIPEPTRQADMEVAKLKASWKG